MSRRRNVIRNERGQTMVEFALVVPILCLVLFGILQFGALYNDYVTLTDATRVGARKAAVSKYDANPEAVCRGGGPELRQWTRRRRPRHRRRCHRLGARRIRDRHCHLPLRDRPSGHRRGVRHPRVRDNGACRMNRLRSEAGQAAVLSVVFMAALLGAVALVLDVGSWFRAQRATQSAADAAALAGAQELPESTGLASAIATQYLTANGGGDGAITFSTRRLANDTINVGRHASGPGSVRQDLRDRLGRGARARGCARRDARQCPVCRSDRRRQEASAAQLQAASVLQRRDDARPREDRARCVQAAESRSVRRAAPAASSTTTGS